MLGPSEGSRLTLIPHFRRPPVRNGQDQRQRQRHRFRARGHDPRGRPRIGHRHPHALLVSEAPHRRQLPDLPGVGRRASRSSMPACATPATDGMVVDDRVGGGGGESPGVLGFLLERYPGASTSPNGGREHPRNEFERYVAPVRRPGPPTPASCRSATATSVPATSMIQHDMSTCILCTRCVRACEDIQEVGVLDVGDAGRAHRRSSSAATATPTTRAAPGAASAFASVPTGAIFEFIPRQRVHGPRSIAAPDRTVARVGLPLLRRRVPDRPAGQWRAAGAGHLALDRGATRRTRAPPA